MQEYDTLHSRLKNCLQTILELEPDLDGLELGQDLMKEFSMLKSFMEKLEGVVLEEEDVRRIEKATAHFLEELERPLATLGSNVKTRRYLQ